MSSVDYLAQFQYVMPEVIVSLAALAVLFLDRLALRDQSPSLRALIGAMFSATACFFAAFWMSQNKLEGSISPSIANILPGTSLAKQLILLLAIPTALCACDSKIRAHVGEFFALILLSTVGMLFLVSSENLLMIFVCLELATLPLYLLACFDKSDRRAPEAALKYFLFGGMAAAFTLFGMSLIYGYTGSLQLPVIAQKLAKIGPEPLLLVAITMTIAGFGFKIAVAPFHLWAPDVYETAPLPTAALVAAGSKLASFVILARFTALAFSGHRGTAFWDSWLPGTAPLLAILAGSSMVIGNLVALRQTSVRRLLAYSAISHSGYMAVVIAGNPADSLPSILYYAFTYGLATIGAFIVVTIVQSNRGNDTTGSFTGLSAQSPGIALCLMCFLLSLAGIPPLAGFFGKFYLFGVALRGKPSLELLWLVIVAIGMSAVSLYYYVKILKAAYVAPTPKDQQPLQIPPVLHVTLYLLAAAILVLGLLPTLLLNRLATGH